MITEKPACDWLTITTYSNLEAGELFDALARCARGTQGKQGRVMQYEGRQWEGLFWGEAVQRQRLHYMARASGEKAHHVLKELAKQCPGSCTRIDLQITIPLPQGYSARALADYLNGGDWLGTRRAITLVEGGKGLDTVYVGSRTSGRYYRIYVKEADAGRYLRFEVEFKGDYSQYVYNYCCINGERGMGDVLGSEISTLPHMTQPGLSELRRALVAYTNNPAMRQGVRVSDNSRTMAWMARTVFPAAVRMLRDHDQGDKMAQVILELYEMARDLDRL